MTTFPDIIARMLDPAGGGDVRHPDWRLRLNFRRIELMAVVAIMIAVIEGIFSYERNLEELILACIAFAGVSTIFLAIARHAQRVPAGRYRLLPEIFVISALMGSQSLCYFISLSGRIATGYGLLYLACAAFFLIPPRRFAIIGAFALVLFCSWVFFTPLTPFNKIILIFNTALAIGCGMLGRWGLDRLESVNEEQKRKIAEQNGELLAINDRLRRTNEELNGLMAVAAHDLRSPLFGLRNLLELASAKPPHSTAEWREVLAMANSDISSMLALIGGILQSHQAELTLEFDLQTVDLAGALEAAVARNKPTADKYAISLTLAGSPRPAEAKAQRQALDQIIDNLLSNAIRFSPAGSQVQLAAIGGEVPIIEVRDRGTGVAESERTALFDKFRRGSARPLNGPWGSGLGLHIVRTLAERMGAEASYAPRTGGGSIFRITFAAATRQDTQVTDKKHDGRVAYPARGRA